MEKKEEYDFFGLGMKYSQLGAQELENRAEDYRINYGGEAAEQFVKGAMKGLEAYKAIAATYFMDAEDPSKLFDNSRDDLRNYR